MDHPLIVMLREHAVVVMVVLFAGVLYWAFRGRMRSRRRNGNKR